ncbi:MAG: Tad domain-containing protein, partial [Firmicutes bacterium]|nr:Tad domain-containing protein [Bacillota bacterium]
MKKLFRDENGAALILVALFLTVLVGIAGLVLDGGMQYVAKTKLQNSVDAAALAGATALANGSSDSETDTKASDIAHANNLDLTGDQVIVTRGGLTNGKYTTVNVSASRTVPFGLMKVLGFGQRQVPADATAAVKVVTGMGGLIPVCVMPGEINWPSGSPGPTDEVLLKGGSQEKFASTGPGGFRGLLSLDGKHGSNLGPIFLNGCAQVITVGTEDAFIDEENGNVSSLASYINQRI